MIAVDWGSSSLRAYRLDAKGDIVDQRRSALGLLARAGDFEATLKEHTDGWDDRLIVLVGMVGSRQGWHEMPYVACPATLADIAREMVRVDSPAFADRSLWFVPGLISRRGVSRGAELLRGEETQLLGLLERIGPDRQIVCLPGSHSKWAVVSGGRIESFVTAMTGELYQILCKHSLLGRLMKGDAASVDESALRQGVEQAQQAGGLSYHLFSVRASGLLGTLQPEQLASYLSALLIAHEVLDSPWISELSRQAVHLIGSARVLEPYTWVLRALRVATQEHGETLTATGAYLLARHQRLA